jgi:hypothetical protein
MPNAHQKLAASENDLPDAMGWMDEGNRLFQWPRIVDSDAFSFTLYGKDGEVVVEYAWRRQFGAVYRRRPRRLAAPSVPVGSGTAQRRVSPRTNTCGVW